MTHHTDRPNLYPPVLTGLIPKLINVDDKNQHQVPPGLSRTDYRKHTRGCNNGTPSCPPCIAREKARLAAAEVARAEKAAAEPELPVMPSPEETNAAARELATHTVVVEITVEPPMGAHVCPADGQTGVGIMIAEVLAGSNAERAGVERGDIVLTINGISVVAGEHSMSIAVLQEQPAGDRVLQVARVVPGAAPAAPENGMAVQPHARKCSLHKANGASLGIQLAPATAEGNGLVVHELSEDGVAKQGGVVKGDEIASIFGINVQNLPYDQAIAVISSKPVDADGGTVIDMTLINQSVGVGMDYTVANQESAGEAVVVHLVVDGSVGLGFELAPATAEKKGLVVVGVAEAGLAATAGVTAGDVVVAVNGVPVATVAAAEAVRMVAAAAATGAVALTLSHPIVFGFPA